MSGDSAKAELHNLKHVFDLTLFREAQKDSIILQHEAKSILCIKQVDLQNEKIDIYTVVVDDLQKQNRKLRRGVKILGVTVGFTTLTALIVAIVK